MKYNTEFEVKYFAIEQELLQKCTEEKEECYTQQDVLDICDKLYRDELLSVFNAENIGTIDSLIIELFEEHLQKTQISIMVDHCGDICYGDLYKTHMRENMRHVIFMAMFSHSVFHVIHPCIVQQMQRGQVDNELISQCEYLTCQLICKGHN